MRSTVHTLIIAALALSASMLLPVNAATGDLQYTYAGMLVNAGPTKLNFYCMGKGSPTVVFDAGWEDWSPSWAIVQPAVARYTRACAYDRAGSGFSEAAPMPRSSGEIATELYAALHDAHILGPYLLVGHSFGGYNIRAFADTYMPQVYGAVFVDIESGDLMTPKARAEDNRGMAQAVAELERCRTAVAAHEPLPPLPTATDSSFPAPHTPCSHQFFRGLPMKEWSPQLNGVVLRVANTRVALYDAVISEMQQMPGDADWLIAHRTSFGSRPLRILTAQNHSYDTAKTPIKLHREHLAFEHSWAMLQSKYLTLSSNAKQILVPNSGHYIQLDQPQIVIDAIRSELTPRP